MGLRSHRTAVGELPGVERAAGCPAPLAAALISALCPGSGHWDLPAGAALGSKQHSQAEGQQHGVAVGSFGTARCCVCACGFLGSPEPGRQKLELCRQQGLPVCFTSATTQRSTDSAWEGDCLVLSSGGPWVSCLVKGCNSLCSSNVQSEGVPLHYS